MQRIVSLLPAATDIVVALGAADRLVGRTHECDWPTDGLEDVPVVTRTAIAEDMGSREIANTVAAEGVTGHRGSALYQLDHDALRSAAPDLILTQDLCQVCAVSYRSISEAVRVLEMDTTVVSLQPRTFDHILQSISDVGRLLGIETAAGAVVQSLRNRWHQLPGSTSPSPPNAVGPACCSWSGWIR